MSDSSRFHHYENIWHQYYLLYFELYRKEGHFREKAWELASIAADEKLQYFLLKRKEISDMVREADLIVFK